MADSICCNHMQVGVPRIGTHGRPSTYRNSHSTATGSPSQVVVCLEGVANGLIYDSLANSSQRVYRLTQEVFIKFCTSLQLPSLQTTECVLVPYVAELTQRICHATATAYLAAISHMHLSAGLLDLLTGAERLGLVLWGFRHRKPRGADTRLTIPSSYEGLVVC